MTRGRWFDPLLTVLRDQPGETEVVTLTLVEIAVLAEQPLPRSVLTRTYWWNRRGGSVGSRLAAIGWRVTHAQRHDEEVTLTFVRVTADTIA